MGSWRSGVLLGLSIAALLGLGGLLNRFIRNDETGSRRSLPSPPPGNSETLVSSKKTGKPEAVSGPKSTETGIVLNLGGGSASSQPKKQVGKFVVFGALEPEMERSLGKLASPDEAERSRAVEDLGFAAADDDSLRSGLEPLFRSILRNDGSGEVRAMAAEMLSEAEQHETLELMVNSLGDADEWVVDNVSAAIQSMDGRIVPFLKRSLDSPNREISYESAMILENNFGYRLGDEFWFRWLEKGEGK